MYESASYSLENSAALAVGYNIVVVAGILERTLGMSEPFQWGTSLLRSYFYPNLGFYVSD